MPGDPNFALSIAAAGQYTDDTQYARELMVLIAATGGVDPQVAQAE